MPGKVSTHNMALGQLWRTVLEIHRNIVASNVRGHCNDRCVVKLANKMGGRDTVKVWHDDVHEN